MIKHLKVFDIDGTLFRSPEDTPHNKKLYEQHTGVPWNISKEDARLLTKKLGRPVNPRSGWWGKKETLLPPLVPHPVPYELWIQSTINAFNECIKNPFNKTIVLTGRHTGLEQEVLRILSCHKSFNVSCLERTSTVRWKEEEIYRDGVHRNHYRWEEPSVDLRLLGMDGPCPTLAGTKPTSTREWKVWIIQQYRLTFPFLETIEFWEDRQEHVEHFLNLKETFQEAISVNHVQER